MKAIPLKKLEKLAIDALKESVKDGTTYALKNSLKHTNYLLKQISNYQNLNDNSEKLASIKKMQTTFNKMGVSFTLDNTGKINTRIVKSKGTAFQAIKDKVLTRNELRKLQNLGVIKKSYGKKQFPNLITSWKGFDKLPRNLDGIQVAGTVGILDYQTYKLFIDLWMNGSPSAIQRLNELMDSYGQIFVPEWI
ncbi:MAG: hypothetical protein RSD51_03335 [Malacoplasma sp.]